MCEEEQSRCGNYEANNRITTLALLSPVEYDQAREGEAKKLNIRVGTLDKEVEAARKVNNQENSTDSIIEDVRPCSDKVDGEQLLIEIQDTFKKYSIIPSGADIALPLWILGTYCFNSFRIFPMVGLSSPEKRCGKSTVMSLLKALSNRAILASNISPAAIYRVTESWQPTLLIDEADTYLKDNDELKGIINSGHSKDTAYVIRCEGENSEPKQFSTWTPKAIAMIGELPDTNRDRSIVVTMRRRMPGEKVDKLPIDFDKYCVSIRGKCLRWAMDNNLRLSNTNIKIPDIGNDRATDNWTPLITMAEIIGAEWTDKAIESMKHLSGGGDDDNIGAMILIDIKSIFEEKGTDRIFSEDLLVELIEREDRPWCEWRRGNPMSKTSLSRLLKPYKIRPQTIRYRSEVKKGYRLGDFQDVFSRYLPPETSILDDPSVTPLQASDDAGFGRDQNVTSDQHVTDQTVTDKPSVTDGNTLKANAGAGCNGVTDGIPDLSGGEGHTNNDYEETVL